MKKKLLLAAGVGGVLVLGLVVLLVTGLGHAIKIVVERVGSAATGTDVRLASADVSLTSGEGRLTGLVVGNPKGYATPCAFELGDVSVKLDTSTVGSDVVVVREVIVDGPHVTYELGTGGTNIGCIQDHVAAFGGGSSESAASKDDGGRRFVIEHLYVRNGKVSLATSVLGDRKAECGLGEIHLRDIGKGGAGATAAEVATALLSALAKSSLDAASGLALDPITERAGRLGDALKGVLGK
jgi:hypothetical protein